MGRIPSYAQGVGPCDGRVCPGPHRMRVSVPCRDHPGGCVDLGIALALLGGAALAAGGALVLHRATLRREARRRARLAHDLRTPLSSILAYAEILQDGVPEDDRQRFLSIIRHEAGRMDAMIDERVAGNAAIAAAGNATGAAVAAAAAVATTAGDAAPIATGRRGTVLVVDDDRFIVEATCRLLEREGFAATGATGGAEAIDRARAARPDLILMDLTMPAMDGGETLGRLRAESTTHDIPVIITTGDVAAAPPAGAFAVLTKPVSRETLLDAVTRALGAMSGGATR